MKLHKILIAAALSAVLLTGCGHIQSIKPNITNTDGDLGGGIEIVFKNTSGVAKSFTVAPVGRGTRGFDTGGKFVTLGEIKTTAIAAYKARQSGTDAGRAKGYNGFDCDTVAIIVGSLTSYNADPNSL